MALKDLVLPPIPENSVSDVIKRRIKSYARRSMAGDTTTYDGGYDAGYIAGLKWVCEIVRCLAPPLPFGGTRDDGA